MSGENQGAQEYPIRALVLVGAVLSEGCGIAVGDVISVKRCDHDRCLCDGFWSPGKRCEVFFDDRELIINPSKAQIAKVRQKAGLPPLSATPTADAKEAEPSRELIAVLVDALKWVLGDAGDCPRCHRGGQPCVGHSALNKVGA